MGIYFAGPSGVPTEPEGIDASVLWKNRHILSGYLALSDGIPRKFYDAIGNLDHFLIDVTYCRISQLTEAGAEGTLIGETKTACSQYGSITMGSNYLQVSESTVGYIIRVDFEVFAVFKDGCKVPIQGFAKGTGGAVLVNTTQYVANPDGYIYYVNSVLGRKMSGSFTNSLTETNDIVPSTTRIGELSVGRSSGSGSGVTKATINSIKVNGTSYPVVWQDSLPA